MSERHRHTEDCQHSAAYWFAEADRYARRANVAAKVAIGFALLAIIATIVKAVLHG